MKNNSGVEIEEIQKGSVAEKAGLKTGDRLVAVNGHGVSDEIDLIFFGNEPHTELLIRRDKKNMTICVPVEERSLSGIGAVLKPFKIRTCRNNCIFCFVAQLPKGLRRSLYVRDEDYRMSFLYGNYITMTNLSDADKGRIIGQRLSPLYISVHSTNTEIRNKLIGNPNASDILKEIKFLATHKIRMHTQIVLCPGYNDGRSLEKTITDLYKYYPYVVSIAVVPVGITEHRKKMIKAVEKEDAVKAIEIVQKLQTRFRRKHGDNIVYAADEMYIKAEIPFPVLGHYGELSQIENGVGMMPLFLHQARRLKIPQKIEDREQLTEKKGKRFITFTGTSFYPYLMGFTDRLRKAGHDIEAVAVENSFFGKSVTVAGLLTGRDVIKSLLGIVKRDEILFIPDVVMKEGDEVFLDDVSRQDVEDLLGVRAVVIESTPKGVVDAIAGLS